MNLIFDLDQTLVNSESLEKYRASRNWKMVYSLISTITVFDGLNSVLKKLREQGHKTAIVTSSPSVYCSKVLKHCNMNFDTMVCYHDTLRKKPYPDPILLAIKKLYVTKENLYNTLSFGDKAIDIVASKRAGVKSVACTWGTSNEIELLNSQPDFVLNKVNEILDLVNKDYSRNYNH